MAIEKNSTILIRALKQGYGVAAFNLFNYESVAWAIEAANLRKHWVNDQIILYDNF